jgi:hypothetical protein
MLYDMTTDNSKATTETWYITFGIGTRHGKQYTEVVVDTVEHVEGYDMSTGQYRVAGQPLDRDERRERVRAAAVESYGTAWAFEYAPWNPPSLVLRGCYSLRERIGARRPDGSLVPVVSATGEVALSAMALGEEIERERGVTR